jgi:hypothetical protein
MVKIIELLFNVNFGFRVQAASNAESGPMFWQTLKLPSSG